MEDLKKQSGEKQRKMETKVDSKAHVAPTTKQEEEHTHEEHEHVHAHEHVHEHKEEKAEVKTEEKKPEKKKVKKEMAYIKMSGLAISTKQSRDICRFIKGKEVETAIKELERVVKMKKAIPMRGEIPHRKGKGMMSGRYPKTSAAVFIKVLKSLAGNANVNGIDEPVITMASASWGARPMKRGGMKFKRTHLYIEAREKMDKKEEKSRENKSDEGKK